MREMHPEHIQHCNGAPGRRNADPIRIAVRRPPRPRPDVAAQRSRIRQRITSQYDSRNDSRARNVARLRDRVDEGDCDGTLRRRARERVADPCVEYDEARVHVRHEEPARR